MKVSVVIPTYNSAAVIRLTLDSVLRQTVQPDEILVLDDGSTDATLSILESYRPKVSVLRQQNRGVAAVRNELSRLAKGDLVAFLDHDDLWHPRYLEIQSRSFAMNPAAAAFFTLHDNFYGLGDYEWSEASLDFSAATEMISPVSFMERYNNSTGTFYSMSFCCIPKSVLTLIGAEPFCRQVNGVDDCYLCNLLPLFGPVVFKAVPLVAYRVTPQAQSVNQLKNFQLVVEVFQLLEDRYRAFGDPRLWKAFTAAFAGKRRGFGKILMGAGRIVEARRQFLSALRPKVGSASAGKSFFLLCLSFMPKALQPIWPSAIRVSEAQSLK